MKIEEVLYLPVKLEGFSISTDELDCKSHYRTLDGEEVSSSFKAKSKEELLDQPKPVLPQFVAEWIEICDMRFVNLNYIFGENCPEKVKEWASVYGNHKKMLQTLLYGYTVEKEKLYTVEIPNPNKEGFEKLVLGKCYNNKIAICLTPNENWEKLGAYKLTEQEIRKDFDWAWQQGFAKEVEY